MSIVFISFYYCYSVARKPLPSFKGGQVSALAKGNYVSFHGTSWGGIVFSVDCVLVVTKERRVFSLEAPEMKKLEEHET